jgi:hypothetical protein
MLNVMIAIAINVVVLIIVIAIQTMSAIAQHKLAHPAIHAAVSLAHTHLFAKLGLQLELQAFFDVLNLHALKQAVKLVLCKLHLK